MKRLKQVIWLVIAIGAAVLAGIFLYRELHNMTLDQFMHDITSIPLHRYLLALLSTAVAYFALAWYDRIALIHLGIHHIRWMFVSLCSFTTYALAHNIGFSVFSGALVRYRAYSAKGLSTTQIAILVALCSYTFALGVIILCGIIFTFQPEIIAHFQFSPDSPIQLPRFLADPYFARFLGLGLLAFAAIYVIGSLMHLRPLRIKRFVLEYPKPAVMLRQLIAGPLELLGAAGIIYFALPEAWNPGYVTVLTVFLVSFSIALVSNVPGGYGVFEAVFFAAMPGLEDAQKSQVFAALVVFRLFYLLIPLVFSAIIILLYERAQFKKKNQETNADNLNKTL